VSSILTHQPVSSSFASTSWFHSSAPSLASRSGGRQKKIKLSKKAKTEIKEKRYLKAQADRPSPITGVKIGEENKWFASDLAKVIVRPDELTAPSDNVVTQPIGLVTLPSRLAFGLSNAETEETQKLFGDLPELSSTAEALGVQYQDLLTERLEKGQRRELLKANQFAKLVDLRNADAKGLAFENRRRIIAAFSTPENPFDTGRSEVQGAQQLETVPTLSLITHL